MTLQDLFERVMINSGQFQYDPEEIELDVTKFLTMVNVCLGVYNKYCPWARSLYRTFSSIRQWTFTVDNTPESNGIIPKNIISVTPIRTLGLNISLLSEFYGSSMQIGSQPINDIVKGQFPFSYRKPILTLPLGGDYDILAMFDHQVTQIPAPDPLPDDYQAGYEILTISDSDSSFIDMVTARFMIGMARSRRAFTMQDLPIQTDASDMVSEGKELLEKAEEDMSEKHSRWYLAWGG